MSKAAKLAVVTGNRPTTPSKMNKPDNLEQRRFLFQMFFANRAFTQARETCDYLYKHYLDVPTAIRDALATSIHIDYGRPFTMNYGAGKLSTEIISPEFISLHERLIELRNKYFAHSDAERIYTWRDFKTHSVYLQHHPPEKMKILIGGLNEPPTHYKRVLRLLDSLTQKTQYYVLKTFSKHGKKGRWLKTGSWRLSIDPSTSNWWVRIPDVEWNHMMRDEMRDGAQAAVEYLEDVDPDSPTLQELRNAKSE